MRPTGQPLIGDAEPALFSISSVCRLDETTDVVLAEDVEMAISVADGPLPNAAIAPDHLAARKFEARENRVVEAVDVAIDQHDAAAVALHVTRRVNLLAPNLVAGGSQSEQGRARAVRGREEHFSVRVHGRRDVGRAIG